MVLQRLQEEGQRLSPNPVGQHKAVVDGSHQPNPIRLLNHDSFQSMIHQQLRKCVDQFLLLLPSDSECLSLYLRRNEWQEVQQVRTVRLFLLSWNEFRVVRDSLWDIHDQESEHMYIVRVLI